MFPQLSSGELQGIAADFADFAGIASYSNDWIRSKWIQRETKILKFIGEGCFGDVCSFMDEENVQKALKVVEYWKMVANILEQKENPINVGKWFKEAKREIKNLHLLDGCEFIISTVRKNRGLDLGPRSAVRTGLWDCWFYICFLGLIWFFKKISLL